MRVSLPVALVLVVGLVAIFSPTSITAIPALPAFPALPTSYSSVVVANFRENNYTLAYEEFWDEDAQILRTNGRFRSSQLSEVLNYGTNISSVFSLAGGDTSCNQTAFDGTNGRLGPSKKFFIQYILSNLVSSPVYIGQPPLNQTRYILCDSWTGSSSFVKRNSNITVNFTYIYYAAVPTIVGLEYAPVRMDVSGTDTDWTDPSNPVVVSAFSHVYDWIKFSFIKPATWRFALPSTCTATSATGLPPRSSSRGERITDTLPPDPVPTFFPVMAKDFKIVMEAKIDQQEFATVANPNPTPKVFTYTWFSNETAGMERLDYHVLTSQTNDESSGSVIGAGQYTRIELNDPTGQARTIVQTYDSTQLSEGVLANCSSSYLTLENADPLESLRAGSIEEIWSPFYNITYSPVFVQRTNLRGMEVDEWIVAARSKLNGNNFYVWDEHIFTVTASWRFPGRENIQGIGVPVRVINIGSYYNASYTTPIPYTDVYDFFLLLPEVASPAAFDFSQITGGSVTCPAPAAAPSDAVFPTIAPEYETYIQAAILNKGYTMSFYEIYSSTQNYLKQVGRNGTALIYDSNLNLTSSILKDHVTCQQAPFGTNYYSQPRPSASFFSQYANLLQTSASSYVGRYKSWDSRYITADRWVSTRSITRGNVTSTFNLRFYSLPPSLNIKNEAIPLRIEITGVRYTANPTPLQPAVSGISNVFTHVYDFIQYRNMTGKIDASVTFSPPATGCQAVASLPISLNIPPSSRPALTPAVSTDAFPSNIFPNSFSAIVEVKSLAGVQGFASEAWTAEWSVDLINNNERIRYIPTGHETDSLPEIQLYNFDQPTNEFTGKWTGLESYTSFQQFTGDELTCDPDSTGVPCGVCTSYAIDFHADIVTPIFSDRYNSRVHGPLTPIIRRIILEDITLSATQAPQVAFSNVPRDYAVEQDRGISCDRWQSTRSTASVATSPLATYLYGNWHLVNYTATWWTSIPGWRFLGLDMTPPNPTAAPVRLNVAGFEMNDNTGVVQPWEINIDFYYFMPGSVHGNSIYDANTLCSSFASSTDDNTDDSSMDNHGSAIAGGVIITIVVVAGIATAIYCWYRNLKRGSRSGKRTGGSTGAAAAGVVTLHTSPNSERAHMNTSDAIGSPQQLHDIDVDDLDEPSGVSHPEHIELQQMDD